MEQTQSSQPEANQSEADDWVAGSTVEAQAQGIALGAVEMSFDGLDLPEPSDPTVA